MGTVFNVDVLVKVLRTSAGCIFLEEITRTIIIGLEINTSSRRINDVTAKKY